jgi:hypothetical protein
MVNGLIVASYFHKYRSNVSVPDRGVLGELTRATLGNTRVHCNHMMPVAIVAVAIHVCDV